MNINIGDILTLKKKHPCGSERWRVTRIGADFKITCLGCGHELMLPRSRVERNIKKIEGSGEGVK